MEKNNQEKYTFEIFNYADIDFDSICEYCEEYIVSENLCDNGGTLNFTGLTFGADFLIICLLEGKIIGFNSVILSKFDLYICQIAILKAYQGQGLGTKLMEKAIAIADKYNVSVTAHVRDYNSQSQKMFNNLNFIKDSEKSTPENYFYIRYQPQIKENKSNKELKKEI